jgi:hypothetical protein
MARTSIYVLQDKNKFSLFTKKALFLYKINKKFSTSDNKPLSLQKSGRKHLLTLSHPKPLSNDKGHTSTNLSC